MRPLLRRFILAVAAFCLLLLALATLLLTLEFSLPLDGARGLVARELGRVFKGEVQIAGSLRLLTGLNAGIELKQLHMAGDARAGHWSADIGQARLRVHLFDLLHQQIRVTEFSAAQATVCATRSAAAAPAVPSPPARTGSAQAWRLSAIERVRIERARLVIGESCVDDQRSLELGSLEASMADDGALQVISQGRFRQQAWQLEGRAPLLQWLADPAQPLAFELTGEFAQARLHATGTAALAPFQTEADISLDSAQFGTSLALLGLPFRDFGPLSVRAHLQADRQRQALRIDQARLTPGTLAATMEVDASGTRPQVKLNAQTGQLDALALQNWLAASMDDGPAHPGRWMQSILAALRTSDGQIKLALGRLSADRMALDALDFSGEWRRGRARAALNARMGQQPIRATGQAEVLVDAHQNALAFSATVSTGQFKLPQHSGVSGSLGKLQLQASGRGVPGGALEKSLRVELKLSDGRFRLPAPQDSAPQEQAALTISSAEIEGSDAGRWLQGKPWPLRARGAIGARPVELAGEFSWRRGHKRSDWRLDLAELHVGNSQGRVHASGVVAAGPQPVKAELDFDVVDLAEWMSPSTSPVDADRVLLPRLALPEADLSLRVARLLLPGGKALQAQASARTRGGRLEASPFSITIDGKSISGTLAADLQPAQAQLALSLEATGLPLDLGMPLKMGHAQLSLTTAGSRLRELAASADLRIEARDISIEGDTRQALAGTLASASLNALPGQPTVLSAAGVIGDQPMSLKASGGGLAELLGRALDKGEQASLSADLDAVLGESRVAAQITRRRVGQRPVFELILTAPLLRLEDLRAARWPGSKNAHADRAAPHFDRGGLRAALGKFDGHLHLAVERLTSSGTELGRLDGDARLEAGQLRVTPLQWQLPRGTLQTRLDADFSSQPTHWMWQIDLENFEYRELARILDPTSGADGSLNLKLRLAAQGDLDGMEDIGPVLVPTLEGQIGFVIFPHAKESRFLDLWGSGLLRVLVPALDQAKDSRLNCAVATFNLGRNHAKSSALMIDSTKVRAAGELDIDLAQGTLKGTLAPKPKDAELFSTQQPVVIGGTLKAPKVGVTTTGLTVAAARLFYFEFAFLYDAVTTEKLGADGSVDCMAIYYRLESQVPPAGAPP